MRLHFVTCQARYGPLWTCYDGRMASLTFDTLKFADTLKAAGVPPAQAEAQARAVSAVISDVDVASRRDVADLQQAVSRDIADVRKDIAASELRLTVKLGAFLSIAVGVIIAALRLPL